MLNLLFSGRLYRNRSSAFFAKSILVFIEPDLSSKKMKSPGAISSSSSSEEYLDSSAVGGVSVGIKDRFKATSSPLSWMNTYGFEMLSVW